MFDSSKLDLKTILADIDAGKLQLPEFQRSYVWNDSDVRSLLASVAKGYPVGALLTLQTGGDVKFKPRLIEGVPPKAIAPGELLLDGQQRMTSLYQVFFASAPVRTKDDKKQIIDRYYYLDIKKCLELNADIGDAIVAVSGERTTRKNFGKDIDVDLRSQELEFKNDMFPLNAAFDTNKWLFGWVGYWKSRDRDVFDLVEKFDRGILDRIKRYELPIIRLAKDNGREAICLVFEKVNVGGKKLDAFELVTAIYAAHEFDLREDWDGDDAKKRRGRRRDIIGFPNRRDVVSELASTDFLQACTLVHTWYLREEKVKLGVVGKELPAVSCTKDALLALPLDAYRAHADAVQAGFVVASEFLNEQNIIWHKDVPYPPQIVGLAATVAILGEKAIHVAAKEKLATWFWSGVLAEQYGSATESRLARDVPELVNWLAGKGTAPRSVGESIFQEDRLRTLRSRLSAAYKGIHALLMRADCLDFITGKPTDIMTFFNDKIDIHHIFPQKWCADHGIKPNVFNSIVNKTPLSKRSNIEITGDAPSIYLKRIQDKQKLSDEKLDAILRTHLVEPKFLRNDDFYGFFDARLKTLAGLVGSAMSKPAVPSEGVVGLAGDETDPEEIEENEALEGEAA